MKITTWNAEWLDHSWGVISGKYEPGQSLGQRKKAPSREIAVNKIDATKALFDEIDADIIFICEGPEDPQDAVGFAEYALADYDVVLRPEGEKYYVAGKQGLWFFVKKSLADHIQPGLVPVSVWRDFAARNSETIKSNGGWNVSIPRWEVIDENAQRNLPVNVRRIHRFYRHPQTLRFNFGGMNHEIIGAHLKSKYVGVYIPKREEGQDFDDYAKLDKIKEYLTKSHEARIKLSSEALNIRAYIDQRFAQESDPSIFVLGDLNDGPGKELLEREYLLHDLISNLQGEVFFAQRFLNHALFDYPQHLRWTSLFKDKLDPKRNPHILLDHILFTQALTGVGTSSLQVKSQAGYVEHLAFEKIESQFGHESLSDHRPVSVIAWPRGD